MPAPIFALVDCNNFNASCEKLFDPRLAGVPVVARSAEVKALGLPMGQPWFKVRDLAKRHGIVAFSSNYTLYADMSNRVVNVLAHFSPEPKGFAISSPCPQPNSMP